MSEIHPELVNESLLEQACSKLDGTDSVYLIHDPSDIRKPYSSDIENLGKVRDLNGKIINGYSTHNIVTVTSDDKTVGLLSHVSYSNKDPQFLKQKFIQKLKDEKEFEGDIEAKTLFDSGDYFNKKTLTIKELTRVSEGLKQGNKDLQITHILDREFDDDEYLNLLDGTLNDDYVIRCKKSRTIDTLGEDKKKQKLISSKFDHEEKLSFQRIQFKNKTIQDGKHIISWGAFNGSTAVKIRVVDRNGDGVFKDDMLLLTNKNVSSIEDAYGIYLIYLKRSKIEYVFKFLKEGIGWDDMQIRDFKGIQNLLSLCFYLSAYLYEIGGEKTYDDYAVLLADIGGGKGKVTRHFILEGIKYLMGKYRIDRILAEKKTPKKIQDDLKLIVGCDYEIVLK